MPAVPFDAVAAPAGAAPTAATAEIITVTAVATDTLTFTRQSQSSALQSIAATWTITAGATAKTITDLTLNQAKVFNVKAYGAAGDGTTNDTAAIQSAINAAGAAGGGTAYLPAGSYLTSSSISLVSNVQVIGAGKKATIVKGNAGSTATFIILGTAGTLVSNAGIQSLSIDVQNVASAAAVSMYYFTNVTFRSVRFVNSVFKFIQSGVAAQTTFDNDHLNLIECDFIGHAGGSAESVTLANTNHILVDRCYWNSSNFCVLLYQLCTYVTFRDTAFTNVTGTGSINAIVYSLSCNELDFIRCRFTAPINGTAVGGAINGANQSDHGAFGYTSVVGLRTDHCYVQGGLSGFAVGAVLGYTDTGSVIEQCWTSGINVHSGSTPVNTPSKNLSFIGTTIRNCNLNNAVSVLHPALFVSSIPATVGTTYNIRLTSCSFYDTQATPTQLYPIVFDGGAAASTVYPVSGVTITGSQLIPYGGVTQILTLQDGATIGSGVTLFDASSGNVGVGTISPQAALDVTSTTAGFLPPRMTTTQRTAIATPATGLLVYDITLVGLYSYNGTAWVAVTGAGGTAPKLYTYTVAATGGDYTTLQACLAVAPAGSAIKVVGTVTETVATSCTTSNISISGDSESVVVLLDQAANTFSMGGNYWAIRNLNFQAGVSDKGSDATAWIKITGSYNRFSGNTITEKASTTTNFGSSVDLTNLKYSQVDRNVFLSVNKGGSMFYDSTAFRHDIIISGNSFWASSGKAFYVLSTVSGLSGNDIDGITIIGNTGQAASINATYAMIDMNGSSPGTDYFVNVNIENNHFRLLGTGKIVSFGTTSGQNRANRVCSNSGRYVDTGSSCGDIFVNNFNASTISDNTCGNIQAYFMTNSVFSNNTSEIGGFTTGGNNLGTGNLVSANVFNTLLISNATRCSISNNYTSGNFEVDQSTSCTIQGNTVFGSSGLQILNDNRSIISGNFSQSAAITITGTLTTEYGNATGPATGIISTITTPGPLATTSRLVLGNSETHNWKTKGVSYTMTAGDFGIIATAAITVTLPSGTVAGLGYQAEIAPNGFAVTVAATAGSVATTTLSGQVAGKYVSDGTNWISR